jgi:hypothetical protein
MFANMQLLATSLGQLGKQGSSAPGETGRDIEPRMPFSAPLLLAIALATGGAWVFRLFASVHCTPRRRGHRQTAHGEALNALKQGTPIRRESLCAFFDDVGASRW